MPCPAPCRAIERERPSVLHGKYLGANNRPLSGCIEIPPVNGVSKVPVSAAFHMPFKRIKTNSFPYTVLDGPVRLDREGLAARNGRHGRR